MKNNNKGNGNLVKGKSTKKEGSNAERNKEVSKEQLGKVSGGRIVYDETKKSYRIG